VYSFGVGGTIVQPVWWTALVAVSSGVAASGGCRLPDAFAAPRLEPVVLTYLGDSTPARGTTIPAVIGVSVNGVPVPNPRLALSSSDTTILAVTAGGDSLAALALGRVTLTVRLESSVTDSLPTLAQPLRVRP
jgi:hypothetical protein